MHKDRIAADGSPFSAVAAEKPFQLDPEIQYLVDGLVADYPDSPLQPWRVEMALAVADEAFYAASLPGLSDAELIERHGFMETVAEASAKQSDPFFMLLGMHAQCLADLCTRDGIRRGTDKRWGRLH